MGQIKKVVVLGVPIFKHFRVASAELEHGEPPHMNPRSLQI